MTAIFIFSEKTQNLYGKEVKIFQICNESNETPQDYLQIGSRRTSRNPIYTYRVSGRNAFASSSQGQGPYSRIRFRSPAFKLLSSLEVHYTLVTLAVDRILVDQYVFLWNTISYWNTKNLRFLEYMKTNHDINLNHINMLERK
jgi:hypothetical protein